MYINTSPVLPLGRDLGVARNNCKPEGRKGEIKRGKRKRAPRTPHRAPLTRRGGNRPPHPPARRPPKSQIKTPRRTAGGIHCFRAIERPGITGKYAIPLIPFAIPSSALLSPFVDRFWMSASPHLFLSCVCARRPPPSARRARSRGSSPNLRCCCCGNGVGKASYTRTEVLASCGERRR